MNQAGSPLVDYRIRFRPGSVLPGAFGGTLPGSGQCARAVVPLQEHPDPRRLDLRASLRDPLRRLWVRDFAQDTSIRLVVMADMSASMGFRGRQDRYGQLRDVSIALARSAFRNGDAFGYLAANDMPIESLCLPPRVNRSAPEWLDRRLRDTQPSGSSARGMLALCNHLPLRSALICVVSDFNWPEPLLVELLKRLAMHDVVPVVLRDPCEFDDLPARGFATVRDIESGARRFLWLRPSLADAVRQSSAAREIRLRILCRNAGCEPFVVRSHFAPLDMTEYFLRWSTR